jgi:hypothetical protein
MRCVHDQSGEFLGQDFTTTIEVNNEIKLVPTTVKNPQANAIYERIHQTIGNMLRTMLLINPPNDLYDANDMIDSILATAMHATRASANRSLMNNTPGALAFHRDMMLDIPLIADLLTIRNSRQAIIDESLRHANLKRLNHDYRVGEQVSLEVYAPKKLDARWTGPYLILAVHVNGTLTIHLKCAHCRTAQRPSPQAVSVLIPMRLPLVRRVLYVKTGSARDSQLMSFDVLRPVLSPGLVFFGRFDLQYD